MNFQDIFNVAWDDVKMREVSPIMLAFIGDAVHTLFVRDGVVNNESLLLKDYHKKSSQKCRAAYQSQMLDKLMPLLYDNEKDIVRRARNAKIHHSAKNADMETYKKATAYEALVGYTYLKGNFIRLDQILKIDKEI